jgi:type I thyroxine 5'-deiodinase
LQIPTLVDGMDDAAVEAFSAWPERIYIVNRDGQIHYRGEPGPRGFNPGEAKASLIALLDE